MGLQVSYNYVKHVTAQQRNQVRQVIITVTARTSPYICARWCYFYKLILSVSFSILLVKLSVERYH